MTWKGWESYVPGTLDERIVTGERQRPRSKFGNKAVEVDGIRFDSKREAARYQVLKVRMQAGDIRRLQCQRRYPLTALRQDNSPIDVAEYVADFEYEEVDDDGIHPVIGEQWRRIVEDVKGHRTDVYKLKKRWFEAQYGITIRET